MKKGNRSSLIKNILGILFIIIAIGFTIFSEELANGLIFGALFFYCRSVYTLYASRGIFEYYLYIQK